MSTHKCPITGCGRQVPRHLLMCGYHWHMVPWDAACRLYNTWQDGAGYGTVDHSDAMDACILAVEERTTGGRL